MAFKRSLSVVPWALLLLQVTLRTVHGHEQQSATSLLRGGRSSVQELVEEAQALPKTLSEKDQVVVESTEPTNPDLIPAEYAMYKHVDGDVEITLHRVPIQMLENGEEMDPWMQRAIQEGIDLNDYNVTYPGRTAETLEDDHRRHLVSVNAWENNDARYCQYERQKRGLQQVSWSYDLIQQAQLQAAYMSRLQHIQHRDNLATGIDAGWRIICENVSQNVNMGFGGAHAALMNDQGHRDNILNVRVSRIGVGVDRNGPYYYLCEIFKGMT